MSPFEPGSSEHLYDLVQGSIVQDGQGQPLTWGEGQKVLAGGSFDELVGAIASDMEDTLRSTDKFIEQAASSAEGMPRVETFPAFPEGAASPEDLPGSSLERGPSPSVGFDADRMAAIQDASQSIALAVLNAKAGPEIAEIASAISAIRMGEATSALETRVAEISEVVSAVTAAPEEQTPGTVLAAMAQADSLKGFSNFIGEATATIPGTPPAVSSALQDLNVQISELPDLKAAGLVVESALVTNDAALFAETPGAAREYLSSQLGEGGAELRAVLDSRGARGAELTAALDRVYTALDQGTPDELKSALSSYSSLAVQEGVTALAEFQAAFDERGIAQGAQTFALANELPKAEETLERAFGAAQPEVDRIVTSVLADLYQDAPQSLADERLELSAPAEQVKDMLGDVAQQATPEQVQDVLGADTVQKAVDMGITPEDVSSALSELQAAAASVGQDPSTIDSGMALESLVAREDFLDANPDFKHESMLDQVQEQGSDQTKEGDIDNGDRAEAQAEMEMSAGE